MKYLVLLGALVLLGCSEPVVKEEKQKVCEVIEQSPSGWEKLLRCQVSEDTVCYLYQGYKAGGLYCIKEPK